MAKSKKTDSLFDLDLSFDNDKDQIDEINVGDTYNGITVTGNFETDTQAELSETLRRFKEQANSESNLKEKNTSTEYWFATYFASQEQRDAFLRAVGILEKLQDQYIDGRTLARALGIDIPDEPITPPKRFRGLGDNKFDLFDL